MGLAERFKEKIDNLVVLPSKSDISPVKNEEAYVSVDEIAQSLIGKIKNTPCWHEYSPVAQRCMIVKYFDTKMGKNRDYLYQVSGDTKLDFINTILKRIK